MYEIGIGIFFNLIWSALIFTYKKIKRVKHPKRFYIKLKIIFLIELLTGIASLVFASDLIQNVLADFLLYASSFFSFFSVTFIFFSFVTSVEITDNYFDNLSK